MLQTTSANSIDESPVSFLINIFGFHHVNPFATAYIRLQRVKVLGCCCIFILNKWTYLEKPQFIIFESQFYIKRAVCFNTRSRRQLALICSAILLREHVCYHFTQNGVFKSCIILFLGSTAYGQSVIGRLPGRCHRMLSAISSDQIGFCRLTFNSSPCSTVEGDGKIIFLLAAYPLVTITPE